MSNTVTRSEAIAVDVITAKGAALKHAGFWAAMLPLVTRAYVSGNDKEQWSGKGSNARPLRTCWAAAFTAVNGKLPSTAGARAFRAVAAFVSEEQSKKGRDISPDGVEVFLTAAETIVAGIIAPVRTPRAADSGSKNAEKISKAIELLQQAANDHLLSEEHVKLIGDIVTRSILSASKPVAMPASMPAYVSKVTSIPL